MIAVSPAAIRERLLALRAMLRELAAATSGVCIVGDREHAPAPARRLCIAQALTDHARRRGTA